jgi:hypothetical protein
MAFVFFQESSLTAGNIFWTVAVFALFLVSCVRLYFGVSNAVAKYRVYRWHARPFDVSFRAITPAADDFRERLRASVVNRAQETEAANASEGKRLELFALRMRQRLNFRGVGVIAAAAAGVFLSIGSAVAVVLSDWLATMNFNGRVGESWKKAYLRPAVASSAAVHAGPIAPASWAAAQRRDTRVTPSAALLRASGGAPGINASFATLRESQRADVIGVARAVLGATRMSTLDAREVRDSVMERTSSEIPTALPDEDDSGTAAYSLGGAMMPPSSAAMRAARSRARCAQNPAASVSMVSRQEDLDAQSQVSDKDR